MAEILVLKDFIGSGATRKCYRHPANPDKCIKVVINPARQQLLTKELHNYQKVSAALAPYIAACSPALVQTNMGAGLECELLRDDNNEISKPIYRYLAPRKLENTIKNDLDSFVCCLLKNHLYFYDFNLNNFTIQIKNGRQTLKYIDLKSYNSNKSWTYLKLEKCIPALARQIMRRRLKRLYQTLGFSFADCPL